MPQLAQRLGLDLANPLAGNFEVLSHLFQGVVTLFPDAKTHTKNLLFPRSEGRQHSASLVLQTGGDHSLGGIDSSRIFNQITKFNDPMMLPGAVRYGDVPFLLALNAPQQMWIGGEGNQLPEVVEKCYASARAKRPEVFIGSEKMAAAAVSRWMSR